MGESHAELGLFKDCESSPTFSCYWCDVLDPDEPVNMLDTSPNDPASFDCALFEGYGLDGVTV